MYFGTSPETPGFKRTRSVEGKMLLPGAPYKQTVDRIQDTGYKIQDTGVQPYCRQDTGYKIQIQDTEQKDTRHRYRIQDER